MNHRGLIWLALPVLLAGFTPATSELIQTNLKRLRAMPAEHRRLLEANLQRFDALDDPRQRAIRQLDQQVEALPKEERLRYLESMRRYANWLATLPPADRDRLASASPDVRMKAVRASRAETPPRRPGKALDASFWTRSAVYNTIPLFEAVYLLKIWSQLDDADRNAVERLPTPSIQQARILEHGRQRSITPDPSLVQHFRQGLQRLSDQSQRPVQRTLSALLSELTAEDLLIGRLPAPRASGPLAKKASERLQMREALVRNVEVHAAAADRASTPPIPAARLGDFERRLPEWYRQSLDLLPPEPARDRLTRLRRLIEQDNDLATALDAVQAAPKSTTAPKPSTPAPDPGPTHF